MAKKKSTTEQTTLENQINQKEVKISAEDAINQAIANRKGFKPDPNGECRWHERSADYKKVGEILDNIENKSWIFPEVQREFVWTYEQLQYLLKTIRSNYSAGVIILSECEGHILVTDGMQRSSAFFFISASVDLLIKKSVDKSHLSADELKWFELEVNKVLDFKILVETVHGMIPDEIPEYFIFVNNGTPLAKSIKVGATLAPDLQRAAGTISSLPFFKDNAKNKSFKNNSQGRVIAYCALLAASGLEIKDMKSTSLAKRINENSEKVLNNIEKAIGLVERLPNIYEGVVENKIARTLTPNFIGVLMFVLANYSEYSDENITHMINYIWKAKRGAIEEYKETIGSGASDTGKCIARYNLLVNLLEKPQEIETDPDEEKKEVEKLKKAEEKAYKAFLRKYKDTDIYDSTEGHAVFIKKFSDNELKALYNAQCDKDQSAFDKIIINRANSSVS